MVERKAEVIWDGDLRQGRGEFTTGSNVLAQVPLTYGARFENAPGTNPEELLAAAHAGCYTMALASTLGKRGHPPQKLVVRALVDGERREGAWVITRSRLEARGTVPGLSQEEFAQIARDAEKACPVSNALRNNVEIAVDAALA